MISPTDQELPVLIRSLPAVKAFIDALSESLKTLKPSAQLTAKQKLGLTLILVGMLVTETLNWAAFERRSLKQIKRGRLCWLLYRAKIAWDLLLQASIRNILADYGIREGVLAIDDSAKRRSKSTSKIPDTHKVKDKASGGYFNGQELVFMVLITEVATFPVGFRFYMPDPTLSAWRQHDKALKRRGVPTQQRPVRPTPNHERYPTKQALALDLLGEFVTAFPDIAIKAVLADALYATGAFMDQASELTGGAQIVSQLRANQRVASRNSQTDVSRYFARQRGVETAVPIRGDRSQPVTMLAARLKVKAHGGKRRFVVALKYDNEPDYRYLVASDLSWRHGDIVQVYSLRWLVEVFIQDWKAHGGWNKLTKQQGAEGSERGLILSLLCDHVLLQHPEQSIRLKNKQPGMPVGCLIERLKVETLIDTIAEVVAADDPTTALEMLTEALHESLPTRVSRKHMAGRDLGRQEPTASLTYHAKAA